MLGEALSLKPALDFLDPVDGFVTRVQPLPNWANVCLKALGGTTSMTTLHVLRITPVWCLSTHPENPQRLGGPLTQEIVAIRDCKYYVTILLYSYYTTTTVWGSSLPMVLFEPGSFPVQNSRCEALQTVAAHD